MKVLFYLQGGMIGGAETQLLTLCKALETHVNVQVACGPLDITSPFYRKLDRATRIFQTSSPEELAKVIDTERPDIIQHFHNATVSAALSLSKHRPQVIEVVHGRTSFPDDVTQTPKQYTTHVVAVSEDARQFFLRALPKWADRCSVILNGIDTDTFTPRVGERESGPIRILHSGRLCEGDKQYFKMIDACRTIPSRVDWVFQLVGDGVDRDKIFEHARLETPGQVQFFGFREDMAKIYQAADIYISCSPAEGFGLSIGEAAASGLPITMWDCGGIARCFKNDEDALVTNHIGQFQLNLQHLATNPAARKELSSGARSTAITKFSAARMVRDYLALYKKLLRPSVHAKTEPKIEVTAPAKGPRVFGISNPGFTGVTQAVQGWVDDKWIGIPPNPLPQEIEKLIRQLTAEDSQVLIIGSNIALPVLHTLRKRFPKLKLFFTWHASFSFHSLAPQDGDILVRWIQHLHDGLIDGIGFVRSGMEKVFPHPKIFHFPNAVPTYWVNPGKRDLGPGYHIGLFNSGYAWKNIHQALLACTLVRDAVVHTNVRIEGELFRIAGVKTVYHAPEPHQSFMNLLGSMNVNLQLSFTESFGLTFIESYRLGVPCVGSPVFSSLGGQDCVVQDPDDVEEIASCLTALKNAAYRKKVVDAVNGHLDSLRVHHLAIQTDVLRKL